jgi:aspartate/methionine/tyrosine aminotransferase
MYSAVLGKFHQNRHGIQFGETRKGNPSRCTSIDVPYVSEMLEVMGGASTFYFMLDIRASGLGSEAYAARLLHEHGIAVVPGRYYGTSTDGFVRLGIGTEPEARIDAALAKIQKTLTREI